MTPRLKEHYHKTLKPELVKQFGYANTMEVPRLDKIVLNMGVGEGVQDQKKVHSAAAGVFARSDQPGRYRREGGVAARLERRPYRPQDRPADPRSFFGSTATPPC